jgi:hypothetical protein
MLYIVATHGNTVPPLQYLNNETVGTQLQVPVSIRDAYVRGSISLYPPNFSIRGLKPIHTSC